MKFLIVFLMVLLVASSTQAIEVKFVWNQDLPDPNDLVGWKLYYSTVSGTAYALWSIIPFIQFQAEYMSTVQFNPPNLMDVDQWYFVMTAYNASGESEYSNEASGHFIPPSAVEDFSVSKEL